MQIIFLDNGGELRIYDDGQFYYLDNAFHRLDGPACIFNSGFKSWWVNGKRHRLDGPAIEDGYGKNEWYINDIEYSEEDFNVIKEVLWAI